jgi:hypothetical protein
MHDRPTHAHRDRHDGLVQSAIELRHDVEALAQRCQRLYEESNELVVRLRKLTEQLPAAQPDGAAAHPNGPDAHDPVRRWSSASQTERSDA